MKKCIIIPDSFKGTMSALEFCQIAEKTVKRHMPGCEVLTIPVADGGEGTVDCFVCALGAEKIERSVCGPWQENVSAAYCVKDGTAFIEMAQAAGLPMVGEHKNPAKTTTFGVGSLIRDAVEQGCKNIVIGLGGSCTNDAGAGAAAALGTKFYNEKGESFVPTGDTLEQIVSYDTAETERLLSGCTVTAMCDIDNPMYGAQGAAAIFAPQKGADEEMVALLDRNLVHLGNLMQQKTGADIWQSCRALALRAHSAQSSAQCWAASSSPALRPSSRASGLTSCLRALTWSSPARGRWTARACTARRSSASREEPRRSMFRSRSSSAPSETAQRAAMRWV